MREITRRTLIFYQNNFIRIRGSYLLEI